MPTLYLDVCCLNRPFDDQSQDRIRAETEATQAILARFDSDEWEWLRSGALTLKVGRTPDDARRSSQEALANTHRAVEPGEAERQRALTLQAIGFDPLDALHIACAESGGADVLLTTDDRMLRAARRSASLLRVRVMNPVAWLQEIEDERENTTRGEPGGDGGSGT